MDHTNTGPETPPSTYTLSKTRNTHLFVAPVPGPQQAGALSPRAPGELGAPRCGSQPLPSLGQHHLGSSKRSCPKHPQNKSVLISWGRTQASVISETAQVILMRCPGPNTVLTGRSKRPQHAPASHADIGWPSRTLVLWLSTRLFRNSTAGSHSPLISLGRCETDLLPQLGSLQLFGNGRAQVSLGHRK